MRLGGSRGTGVVVCQSQGASNDEVVVSLAAREKTGGRRLVKYWQYFERARFVLDRLRQQNIFRGFGSGAWKQLLSLRMVHTARGGGGY